MEGSGYRRPKNLRFLRIRVQNTENNPYVLFFLLKMKALFHKAEISPRILEEELGSAARYASSHQTDPAIKATFSTN
jgi:hypothetical protein